MEDTCDATLQLGLDKESGQAAELITRVYVMVSTHSLHLFMIPELFLALSVLEADSERGSISHD